MELPVITLLIGLRSAVIILYLAPLNRLCSE
jgi:hypothetical protein